ncbi:MAG: class I SAM-dependent methyltransferase [Hydrococcus sp. Prado102]|jgi:predicted O-methyltransferase YrrM|nr:class I SAM-dependent methyltransferase [Hydrococcus sp. Prado102]
MNLNILRSPIVHRVKYFIKDKSIEFILKDKLYQSLSLSQSEIKQYRDEFLQSKIIDEINERLEEFAQNVTGVNKKGYQYKTGAMPLEKGIYLYSIFRKIQPEIAVETGVCNGVSTTFLLLALEKNQKGKLYSIDLPEMVGMDYEEGYFWEGKKGAAIPKDKESGWIIPTYLRNRWELILGKSQDKLPELLEKVKEIDFFMHDSEHSYNCMWFEFNQTYEVLRQGGVLMSDNIERKKNTAFQDFAKEKGKSIVYLGPKLAFLVK